MSGKNTRPPVETNYVDLVSILFLAGVLLGVILPGWSSVNARTKLESELATCRENLLTISRALEKYGKANQGKFPKTLSELVAGKTYLKGGIPECPSAGKATYENGYVHKNAAPFSRFTVTCQGNNHVDVGLKKNEPYYDSFYGQVTPVTTPVQR